MIAASNPTYPQRLPITTAANYESFEYHESTNNLLADLEHSNDSQLRSQVSRRNYQPTKADAPQRKTEGRFLAKFSDKICLKKCT